jgi:hypothetical protein
MRVIHVVLLVRIGLIHGEALMRVCFISQTGKSSRGGGGDVDGESLEMDEQTRAEMEEAEREADRSW